MIARRPEGGLTNSLRQRLGDEPLPIVVDMLKAEARTLSGKINPFDDTLNQPSRCLSNAAR